MMLRAVHRCPAACDAFTCNVSRVAGPLATPLASPSDPFDSGHSVYDIRPSPTCTLHPESERALHYYTTCSDET